MTWCWSSKIPGYEAVDPRAAHLPPVPLGAGGETGWGLTGFNGSGAETTTGSPRCGKGAALAAGARGKSTVAAALSEGVTTRRVLSSGEGGAGLGGSTRKEAIKPTSSKPQTTTPLMQTSTGLLSISRPRR